MRKAAFRSVAGGERMGSSAETAPAPQQTGAADVGGSGARASARRLALLLIIASGLVMLLLFGGVWLLVAMAVGGAATSP